MIRSTWAAVMRSMVLWLMLPAAVCAQGPTTPAPLAAEPLLQECRSRQSSQRWADCACYTRKVLELRAARPGGSEDLFQMEAHFACPDPAVIEAWQNARCLDQRRLMVPQGIDAAAWCQCRAAEYTRLAMAFAPARHQQDTEANFSNRAEAHCKRTVNTPSNTLVQGVDLSGPWRFRYANLDLHFEGPTGKWSQAPHEAGGDVRHFRHNVTVVGFSEFAAAATAHMHQHPRTQALELRFDVSTRIPYLRAIHCLATEVSATRVAGRCLDGRQNDVGPFTLRRPEAGETVTTLAAAASAPSPGATPVPSPTPAPEPASPPTANPAPAACPGGRTACYTGCASHLTRPGLDMVQRLAQCRQACKAACG